MRASSTLALLAAFALICTGCLSVDVPASPSALAATPRATPAGTVAPRDPSQLVVEVPEDPQSFLPPATDETTQLLMDLIYDPLYRLDEHLEPQPELASALPQVSADGLAWSVPLRTGAFSDGSPVTASDVVFSLRLALSSACPFGRILCTAVSDNVTGASAAGAKSVTIALQQPYAPLLASVLAQLPILSEVAVRDATLGLVAGAVKIDRTEPARQVQTITDATNQDSCLSDTPPFGCRLSDYTPTLEKLLGDAGISLPPRERFMGPTGDMDAEAYAGALLDNVSALDELLNGTADDQVAAALPLLDPSAIALGSGPYVLQKYTPGTSIELRANPGAAGGGPHIARIRLDIVRDPAVASTTLLTGDADWVLQVETTQFAALESAPGVDAGYRAAASERTIVFNVRPGRIYADPAARQAFAVCLDRAGLAQQATGGRAIVAVTPTSHGSWAMPSPAASLRDPSRAIALLQGAGWARGADGIFVKNGKRLSSSIAVRPSRTDLLAFADAAAQQLAECGIELQVQELDLTGDLLLSQLQWPNDFDTVLLAHDLGADPDEDVQPFESTHVTSAQNPADANPGGYASAEADGFIKQARQKSDPKARADLYAKLQQLLATDVPAWPIWYDTEASAIASRVHGPAGPLDPSVDRFWWNIESWTLAGS